MTYIEYTLEYIYYYIGVEGEEVVSKLDKRRKLLTVKQLRALYAKV